MDRVDCQNKQDSSPPCESPFNVFLCVLVHHFVNNCFRFPNLREDLFERFSISHSFISPIITISLDYYDSSCFNNEDAIVYSQKTVGYQNKKDQQGFLTA